MARFKPERSVNLTEHAVMVRDAIDSVLAGSKPWQIHQMRSVIHNAPFSEEEKAALLKHMEAAINEHKLDILKREMTKVLVGAADVSLDRVADEISSLGGSVVKQQQTNVLAGGVPAGIFKQVSQAEMERIKQQIYQNNHNTYGNAAQLNAVDFNAQPGQLNAADFFRNKK